MRTLLLTAAALFGFSLASAATQANTVTIPIGTHQQAHWPQRGDREQSVLRRHGQPLKQHEAIGSPPIKRWDYGDFAVYFEQNAVIHSVAIRANNRSNNHSNNHSNNNHSNNSNTLSVSSSD